MSIWVMSSIPVAVTNLILAPFSTSSLYQKRCRLIVYWSRRNLFQQNKKYVFLEKRFCNLMALLLAYQLASYVWFQCIFDAAPFIEAMRTYRPLLSCRNKFEPKYKTCLSGKYIRKRYLLNSVRFAQASMYSWSNRYNLRCIYPHTIGYCVNSPHVACAVVARLCSFHATHGIMLQVFP